MLIRQADEADARRAISACYYALFNLLIAAAAATQGGNPSAEDSIRRTVQHRDVRRVCDAIAARPASRPVALQRLLVEPLPAALTALAATFIELQEARLKADYDLALSITPSDAAASLSATQTILDAWPTLLPDPNTRTFLLALLFFDRWTRRA